MRQGAEGAWRYSDPYTTEPHRPALLFEYYLFLGHLARWTGLSLLTVYHAARVGAGALLLFAVARLIDSFDMNASSRNLGFTLAFLGGGIGWLLRLIRPGFDPIEHWLTEAYTFQSMANYSHVTLSTALVVLSFADLYRLGAGRSSPWGAGRIAFYSFLQGWVHPRLLLSVVAIGGAAAILGWQVHGGRIRGWALGLAAAIAGGFLPALLTWASVRGDPVWAAWSSTPTPSPSPLVYLAGYGLLWPLASWGAARGVRSRAPWATFMTAWLIVASILPYLPMVAQRRMVQGWNIPLAILSGYALGDALLPRLSALPMYVAAGRVAGLCALLSLSSLDYTRLGILAAREAGYPVFYSRVQGEAMRWLESSTAREEVVLSAMMSGMFIPALAGNRVVVGHWAETLDNPAKQRDTLEFFDAGTPRERREAIARRYGVRYVFLSPIERALGRYDPASDPDLWQRVWRGTATAIYERSKAEGGAPR